MLPALAALGLARAAFVLLVKPQFEAPAERVGPGGIVRDRSDRAAAIERVAEAARAAGLRPVDVIASPLLGPAGNAEFLLHLLRGEEAPERGLDVARAVAEAPG